MTLFAALLLASIRWAEAEEPAAPPAGSGVAAIPSAAAEPAAAPSDGAVIDRVAAVVNDEIITLSEVYDFGAEYISQAVQTGGEGARAQAEREVIERLLERRLVQQEMRTLKLDVVDQDIDRAIAQIAERNGLDADSLRSEVEKSGMAWDQYRTELAESLRDMKFAQSVLRPRINITDDELRDAWLRASPNASASAHVQALVLALPPGSTDAQKDAVIARARKLRDEARAGADFGELAKKNDEGPFGAQAGEMGVFKPGELVETLDQAIQATPTGDVSEPVVLGDGVYLLRVAERLSGGTDFESQRDQVTEQVYQARMVDEQKRWFTEARRRAAVRILLPGAAAAREPSGGASAPSPPTGG